MCNSYVLSILSLYQSITVITEHNMKVWLSLLLSPLCSNVLACESLAAKSEKIKHATVFPHQFGALSCCTYGTINSKA